MSSRLAAQNYKMQPRRWYGRSSGLHAAWRAAYYDSLLFDELLLFPMKLGLSIALASTAMLVSPIAMTKSLQTAGITQ